MKKFLTVAVSLIICLMIVLPFVFFILCGGGEFIITAPFFLVAGWIYVLRRVIPTITWNWGGVVSACVCLLLLTVGLQLFFRWLVQQSQRGKGEAEIPANRWPVSRTLGVLALVVVLFMAGMSSVGMSHHTIWLVTSREPMVQGGMKEVSNRIRSSTNLHQITIAAHTYHDQNTSLPAGGTFDSQGRMLHGWMTSLLPYVEQKSLYDQINLKVPWNNAGDETHMRTIVKMYNQPYRGLIEKDEKGRALGHYAANVRVMGEGKPLAFEDITDGTANTILFGEAAGNFKPWGHPTNWRDPALGINKSPDGFGSTSSSKGANFAFVDGSARVISEEVDPTVLKALSTPAGGETIPEY